MDDGDDDFTHYLGLKGGTVLSRGVPVEGRNEDEWIKIKVTQHTNAEGQPHPSKLKSWEVSNGRIDPRQCVLHSRLHEKNVPPILQHTELGALIFLAKHRPRLSSGPNDSHHPHKGRKMMLFSDGRQRAAKMALKIKKDSAIDEGRTMFVALQHIGLSSRTPKNEPSTIFAAISVSLLRPCASTHSATRRRCPSVADAGAQCANICLLALPSHGRNRNHPPTLGGKKCVERRHSRRLSQAPHQEKDAKRNIPEHPDASERIEDEDQEDRQVDALKKRWTNMSHPSFQPMKGVSNGASCITLSKLNCLQISQHGEMIWAKIALF